MKWWTTLGLDLVWLLVFAVIGRLSHGETADPAGILETAWPFVVALVGVTVAVIGFKWAPENVGPGALIWVGTVLFGMWIRVSHGATAQVPFIIVASIVIGLGLVGWRVINRIRLSRRGAVTG